MAAEPWAWVVLIVHESDEKGRRHINRRRVTPQLENLLWRLLLG